MNAVWASVYGNNTDFCATVRPFHETPQPPAPFDVIASAPLLEVVLPAQQRHVQRLILGGPAARSVCVFARPPQAN